MRYFPRPCISSHLFHKSCVLGISCIGTFIPEIKMFQDIITGNFNPRLFIENSNNRNDITNIPLRFQESFHITGKV